METSKDLRTFGYCALTAVAISAVSPTTSAIPIELITNGGFETGNFTGWTVTNLAGGTGNWLIDAPGTTTPLSTSATSAAGGSPHGSFYAVTDQTGPGTHVLTQIFNILPSFGAVSLAFDMFANDSDSGPIDTGLLDHTGAPNQHVRVDILSAAAGVFDTGAGVLQSLVAPMVDPQATNPNPFTTYNFDLSTLAAGSYQLRFGEVDNQLFLNMGIDNVSMQATSVPEPASLALLGLGLVGLGWSRHRA